jgi:hypothetical protein
MKNAPITDLKPQTSGTSDVPEIESIAPQSGVLRELALTRGRSSELHVASVEPTYRLRQHKRTSKRTIRRAHECYSGA